MCLIYILKTNHALFISDPHEIYRRFKSTSQRHYNRRQLFALLFDNTTQHITLHANGFLFKKKKPVNPTNRAHHIARDRMLVTPCLAIKAKRASVQMHFSHPKILMCDDGASSDLRFCRTIWHGLTKAHLVVIGN